MWSEEHLERGRVELGRVHRVVNRVLGHEAQRLATSPNWRSRSTITTRPGARLREAHREVASRPSSCPRRPSGTARVRTCRRGTRGSRSAVVDVLPVARRGSANRSARVQLVLGRVGRDHVTRAGAQRPVQERPRDGSATITTLTSGSVVVERAGELERGVGGQTGPEGDHVGTAVHQLADRAGRVAAQHAVTPVAQVALELAVEDVPDPCLEVRVLGREDESAH